MEQPSKKQQPGNITNKKKTKGSAVERSRILSWSWQKKNPKQKQSKNIFQKSRAQTKKNGLAMMKMQAERDDRVVFLLIFSII